MARKTNADYWNDLNKVCKRCERDCKRSNRVKVVECMKFAGKGKQEKRKAI